MKATIPGAHLRHWLAAADMTQAQLARLLNLDAGQVSRWCNDRAPLKGGYANRVIQVFQDRGVKVETPTSGTCAFLSTPMASLDTKEYEADRTAANELYKALSRTVSPVYWAAAQIGSVELFEAPDLAAERNLVALAEAEAFVYLQLRELIHPTSCHVELGIAIALKTPVTIFAPSEDSLPYTLRRFEAISGQAGFGGRFRFYSIRDAADAVRLLTIHGPELLGLSARTAGFAATA
jgi:transcriptional regulator with XRE-family HTH domain